MPTKSEYNIVYIARDIERALGIKPGIHADYTYFIITNETQYAKEIQEKYPKYVFLIDQKSTNEDTEEKADLANTYEILSNPETEEIISNIENPHMVVFKNSPRIEGFCAQKKWPLLNPPSAISELVENKISQVSWLADLEKYLPLHEILTVADIKTSKIPRPFIVQWAHSHTGLGTILIPTGKAGDKILTELEQKFPAREARVTEYIHGPMLTMNISVSPSAGKTTDVTHTICIGNISYQITGTLPFTDNPFSTIGNDWSLPHSILSEANIEKCKEIAEAVGKKMKKTGWKGLFGIDCIYDDSNNTVYLIEINARQAASTTYESELQSHFREHGIAGTTMFEAHLAALSATPSLHSQIQPIEINDGAQIIDRIKNLGSKILPISDSALKKLRENGYTVIEYNNIKSGADNIRIQSKRGIMEKHNQFNSRGKEILEILSSGNM